MSSDDGRIVARYVTITAPRCVNTYGVSPCTASVGTTGDQKCFNTLTTCQDTDNYDGSGDTPITLTDMDQRDLPSSIRAVPNIIGISQTPARISVGGTNKSVSPLGGRATLTITCRDHPYSDLALDPYISDRSYDPLEQGTFWGKWKARNKYREGLPVVYVTGHIVDGAFVEHQRYHYLLESVSGPDSGGNVTISCVDLIAQLRAEQALFPSESGGRLAASITDTSTSFTLAPAGIGNSDYPSSFRCRIGGEGLNVTRSGDTCTITSRGLYGGAEEHDADDTVQEVAQMSGQVHDVAYDIITGAVPSLASNINKTDWDAVAAESLPRVYSADITEPTSVEKLLGELAETAPVYWYNDTRTNRIVMDAIRDPAQVAIELNDRSNMLAGSVKPKEFPRERIDEVWVYYRIRDAAESATDEENYTQRYILVNPEEQQRHGKRSIKRVYTRWIESGGRDTAEEIAQRLISRFQETPVRIHFDLDAKDAEIWLGNVVTPKIPQLQNPDGSEREIDYQIIEAAESKFGTTYSYLAQSYEFFGVPDPDTITISIVPEDTVDGLGQVDSIDLRELYDATVATEIPTINFRILGGPGDVGGTVVGAGSFQTPSLTLPDEWPWSPDITITIESGGAVVGRGGNGGDSGTIDGGDGQDALTVEYAVEINNQGIIAGGGGGGGGSLELDESESEPQETFGGAGGGGAGRVAGEGGDGLGGTGDGEDGTTLNGGDGGTRMAMTGGSGGDLAQAGTAGSGNNPGMGGSPGNAIIGESYITWITEGDIRGARVS